MLIMRPQELTDSLWINGVLQFENTWYLVPAKFCAVPLKQCE